MKIYTKTGDDGTTSLAGGKRIPKYSVRVEAYGTVDELIAWMGRLRGHKETRNYCDMILYIQRQLMKCCALIANEGTENNTGVMTLDEDCVDIIEKEIDKLQIGLPVLNNFILPGGNNLISDCHIARCVCRRAERAVFRVNRTQALPEIVCKFLNRLSDYLFVLSRKISLELDIKEITI